MKKIKEILNQLSIEEKSAILTGKGGMSICGVQELGVGTSLKHFAVNNQEVFRL